MSPRSEEFMAAARDRLDLARVAHESGHPEGALSAAYYAMLYAARAALSEEDRYAKTHSGTWHLFRETFVAAAQFDPALEKEASATQKPREDADYDAASISTERAKEVVDLAHRFVAAVSAMLGG